MDHTRQRQPQTRVYPRFHGMRYINLEAEYELCVTTAADGRWLRRGLAPERPSALKFAASSLVLPGLELHGEGGAGTSFVSMYVSG